MMGDASTVEALVLGPVEIVAMRRRHLRGVVRIDQQTNHRPWSHRLFAGELDLGDQRYYLVALDRSVVVGYGGLMLTGFEAHLTTLAVDPVHHRQGIGARLMAQICAGAIERGVDDITLEVRMTNRGAIRVRAGRGPSRVLRRRGGGRSDHVGARPGVGGLRRTPGRDPDRLRYCVV